MIRCFRHPLPSAALMLAVLLAPKSADAFPFQLSIDRKFPAGTYCPIETRDGLLAVFDSPANGSVRISFAADNFIDDEFNPGQRVYNSSAVDNVMVIPLTQWNVSTSACANCFIDPEGDGSEANAPSFPSDATTLAGLPFAETFASSAAMAGWEGGSWWSERSAPTDDATGNDCNTLFGTDGSLLLGQESDGDVVVSSSTIVEGLNPSESYVVFAWFYSDTTIFCAGTPCWASLTLLLEETDIVSTESSSLGAIKALYDGQD